MGTARDPRDQGANEQGEQKQAPEILPPTGSAGGAPNPAMARKLAARRARSKAEPEQERESQADGSGPATERAAEGDAQKIVEELTYALNCFESSATGDHTGLQELKKVRDKHYIVAPLAETMAASKEGARAMWNWVRGAQDQTPRYADDSVRLPSMDLFEPVFEKLASARAAVAQFAASGGKGDLQEVLHEVLEARALYEHAHRLVHEYRERSVGGAETSVSGLRGVIAACAIVESIASGGLAVGAGAGLVGIAGASAAGAAGTKLLAGTTERVVGVAIGQREDFGMGELLAEVGAEAATTFAGVLIGGKISQYFMQSATSEIIKKLTAEEMSAILARLGEAGVKATPEVLAEVLLTRGQKFLVDFFSGVAAAPLMTAVNTGIAWLRGQKKDMTAREFAGQVVRDMVQAGIVQLFIGAFIHGRAALKERAAAGEAGAGQAAPAVEVAPQEAKAAAPEAAVAPAQAPAKKGPALFGRGGMKQRQQAAASPTVEPTPVVDLPGDARAREIYGGGELAEHGFHGTNSKMLDGLAKTEGQILPASELRERGLLQTGEGSAFSGAPGDKTFVSIGQGEAGAGTALAYAEASQRIGHYNVEILTQQQLDDEITRLKELVGNYDNLTINLDGQLGDAIGLKKGQLVEQLGKLEAEVALRAQLPATNPRRLGGAESLETFPLLFEFDTANLKAVPRTDVHVGGPLGGEASVHQGIDLKERIVRVFAPRARADEVRSRLASILGHGNFEVVALESMQRLPTDGALGTTRTATFKCLGSMAKQFQQVQKALLEALRTNSVVNEGFVRAVYDRFFKE